MDDICERVYNSPQFYINREKLIRNGKSKAEIFNIIKIHLSDISAKTHDLDTIVKSQIIEILKETYNGDVCDAVHSVFRNYYSGQADKIKDHLSLFKEFCDKNSNIKMEELITSLFMNVEKRCIEKISCGITYYVKNEFKDSQTRNDEIYTEYFKQSNDRQNCIQEALTVSKDDIKKLVTSYQRLDQCLKTQTKSNIDLINHIVNDSLMKKEETLKKTILNEVSIQKMIDISIQNKDDKLNDKLNDKLDDKINKAISKTIDEKVNYMMKRMTKLENAFENITDILIKEKQSLHDKIKNSSVLLDRFKRDIKKTIDDIHKAHRSNCSNLSKLNQKIIKLDKSSMKDKELNEKLTKELSLINDTIKSISAQNTMKQSLIFEEIDRNIHDKFKYYNTNENISQLQCEIVKLRAEIDLIYRNQQQSPDFYSGYHM